VSVKSGAGSRCADAGPHAEAEQVALLENGKHAESCGEA